MSEIYDANRRECLRDSALSRGAGTSEEIQGWKPPVIYDFVDDKTRIVTQADVDRLVLIERAYRRSAMVVHETFRDLTNGNIHVLNGRSLYDGPGG